MDTSSEYIPLSLNETIGGSSKIINFLKGKKILVVVIVVIIIALIVNQISKPKNTVNSSSTSNTVSIQKKMNANGEVEIVKTVNGEETQLTEEDKKKIADSEAAAQKAVADAKNMAINMKA